MNGKQINPKKLNRSRLLRRATAMARIKDPRQQTDPHQQQLL